MMKANMKSGTTLRTPFWKAAYQSLPQTARQRHLGYIEQAESWDLALDAASDALSRAKGALARLLDMPTRPRPAHCPLASPCARPDSSSSLVSSADGEHLTTRRTAEPVFFFATLQLTRASRGSGPRCA